jgi:hypothetical protein
MLMGGREFYVTALYRKLIEGLKSKYSGIEFEIDHNRSFDNLIKAFYTINEYLDEINLTKIDTRKQYDGSRVEEENRERGMG